MGGMKTTDAVASVGEWVVTMDKYRATWTYFTENPVGGGFGSNHVGSQRAALTRALRSIPAGATYRLTINGRDRGMFVMEGK